MVSNSTDPKAYSAGRIILVDPNPDNNQLVSPEELNIYVRLRTVTKERSSILSNATGVTGIQNVGTTQLITFMNGSNLGGERNLTTNYTELGTQFNKDNKDLETLGITGIKIDFNSSYAPLITIDFEDVRGQLFTMGNESPYNVFFNLPYPLFELTVKGYYGKSVTYCLHLTKFNGKFNDATGNFEITCNFIGYTYAFLTDMLMGYLRAVTYTEAGKTIADRKRQGFEEDLNKNGTIEPNEKVEQDNTFLTFDELIDGILDLEKDLDKIKKDDEKVKALAKSEDLLSLLSVIEDKLYRKLLDIGGENKLNSDSTVAQGILFIEESKYDSKILSELIDQYNLLVDEDFDKINGQNGEHKDVNFDRSLLKIAIGKTKFITGIKKSSFTNEYHDKSLLPYINDTIYKDLSPIITNLPVSDDQELTLFYISEGFKALKGLEDDIRKRNVATKEEVASELTEAIANAIAEGSGTGIKFKPTIYNFFKILSDHVDIFMDTIRIVSEEAKKDRGRQLNGIKDARNLDKIKGEVQKLENVLPWPEYKEKDEKVGAYVDKWIGNIAPSMPEVKFVEQLLDGMLKSRARDNEILSQLDNGVNVESWYPINPFDTPLFTKGLNPWTSIGDTATQYDVIRLMLLRQAVFFNSHRNITDNEIKAMARLEARNAYSNIKNSTVRQSVKIFGGANNPNDLSNNVISKAKDGFSGWKNDGSNINNNKIIKETNNVVDAGILGNLFGTSTSQAFYEYIYTPQKASINDGKDCDTNHSFTNYGNKKDTYSLNTTLPIFNKNNNYKDYDGNFLINGTNSERIQARNEGAIFFSNYIGGNSECTNPRIDDGSTFVRIITLNEYNDISNTTFPEYGQEIFTDTGILADAKTTVKINDYRKLQFWSGENPSDFIPLFGGIRKTAEFVNLKREFDESSSTEDNAKYISGLEQFPAWVTFYGENNFSMFTPSRRLYGKTTQKNYTPYDVRNGLYDTNTGNFKNGVAVGHNGNVSMYIKDWTEWSDNGYEKLGLFATNKNLIIPMWFTGGDNLKERNLSIRTRRFTTHEAKGTTISDNPNSYVAFKNVKLNLLNDNVTVPYIDYKIAVTKDPNQGNSADKFMGVEYPNNHWSISLFGSDLYYSQKNEEAKAFLFLHTIPFEGLSDTRENATNTSNQDNKNKFGLFRTVHSYFDQKAGFVEAPYSWILFLGGLLKRQKNEFVDYIHTDGNLKYSYVVGQSKNDNFPSVFEYILPAVTEPNGLMFSDPCRNDEYIKIGSRIQKLPQQVKNEFIKQFEDWVSDDSETGWLKLKSKLEIFDKSVTRKDRVGYWQYWVPNFQTNPYDVYKPKSDGGLLRDGVFNDYVIIQKDFSFGGNITRIPTQCAYKPQAFEQDILNTTTVSQLENVINNYNYGSPFNFFLEIRDDSEAANIVVNFMKTTRVIANATSRIWAHDYVNGSDVVDGTVTTRVKLSRFPFRNDLVNFNKYNLEFFNEWIKLVDNDVKVNEEEQAKQDLFNSLNNDDIKLNIYKNIKSIYDKWIAGTDGNFGCSAVDNLIKHFRFIDRTYRDIKDDFKVNPSLMVENMIRDYNQSFYEYIARVLVDNNFDFIPLPNFVDFSSEEEMVSVFKRFPSSAKANQANMQGPQFLCMYIGERSSKLNLGNTSQYENDGFDIKIVDNNGTIGIDTSEFNEGAEDFLDNTTEGKVPAFLVRYGKQNQSVFTNFRLDQSEFSETDESLRIIDDISLKGGPNQASGLGQNLFDIYNTRAYSAEIQMLGDIQIQPLMYFQLYNVPMFHGAYTIIKVTHDIRPNHMTTTFKGHRVRKIKTKMVDDSTIFMNLIGSLSDVNFEGASINNLTALNKPKWAGCINTKLGTSKGISPQADDNSNKFESYGLAETVKFFKAIGAKWNTYAVNKSFTDTLYYRDLSLKYGGDIQGHASHEVGTSIDFRMIRNDKKNQQFTISDNSVYNRDETIKLIKIILDYGLQMEGYSKSGSAVKAIYFNDNEVISEFMNYKGYSNQIVKYSKGHDNHIHLELNLPDRILNGAPDYIDCVENLPIDEENTPNGLAKVPSGELIKSSDKIKYLGKI